MNQIPNQAQDDMEPFEMEGFYEYKGVEKYNPTQEFLKKVFLLSNIQVFLNTMLYFIFHQPLTNYFETNDNFGTVFVIYLEIMGIINLSSFLCTVCCGNFIRSRDYLSYGILVLRIIGVTLFLCAWSSSFKQTLFLILTLHTTLTLFAYYHMNGEFAIKNALKWVVVWAGLMICLISLKDMVFEDSYSISGVFWTVMKVFIYGVYLVVNASILLGKDEGYEVNHHEHVYAALLLQFDMTVVVANISRCYKFITKRQ